MMMKKKIYLNNVRIKWEGDVLTDELLKRDELFRINQLSNSFLSLCNDNDGVSEKNKKKTFKIFTEVLI